MDAVAPSAAAKATPELALQLKRFGDVTLSPDGARIAFAVSASYRERGKAIESRIWSGEVDGELVEGEPGSLPRLSPDGSRLACASDAGHEGRLSLWLDGVELGRIPGSVEDLRWSPDGSQLLVLAADIGADMAGAASAKKIEEAGAAEQDPKVIRPAQFWRRLWLVDTGSGETREVTPAGTNVFELDWAGGKAVAVCTEDPSESAWYDAWIGLIDLDARTVERVHTPKWQLQSPAISPGGEVAFVEGFSSDRGTLTGTVHVLGQGPLAPELHATWVEFADEDGLWVAGWREAGSFAGRLDLDGGYLELLSGQLTLGNRYNPRFAASADGSRIALPVESADEPAEVVLLEGGGRRALTSFNAGHRDELATVEWRDYRWTSFDGREIQGLLALPRERGDAPLPLVVDVHGGPTGSWTWQFAPAYGYPQLYASEGVATLLPNVRGSVGWGPEFAEANLGDMGGGDLQDILTGVDALVADGVVDGDRVAISGGSYGGFMACWAITQSDRFAAAMPFAVVTDWVSFHFTTNIGQFDRLYLQADPLDPEGEYTKRSPLYHAAKCRTPALIVHGEDDLCTPLGQAVEFYNALVEHGCEAQLVVFPREGHGWSERQHHVDAWNHVRDWISRYL
ncbi:MAG TPA: S9 family peptidase [Gaiellaceae bacterium]|nr:S9 family peptidase [Gaiellaceae bacterium]